MRTRCMLLLLLLVTVARAQDPLAHQRLTQADVVNGLKSGMTPSRVATLAEQYGVDFDPTAAADEIRKAGGDNALVQSLRKTADLQVYKLVKAGGLFLANLDLDRATEEFSVALKLDARSLEAQLGLGDAALYGSKLDDALAAYQLAAKAHPEAATAQVKVGKIFEGQGNLEEAQKAYSTAIMLEPTNTDAAGGYARTKIRKELATTKSWPPATSSVGVVVSQTEAMRRFCERKEGIVVAGVVLGGPATKAGLKGCDQILAVDGVPVTTVDVVRSMGYGQPGQTLSFLVLQGSLRRILTVTTDSQEAVYSTPAAASTRFKAVKGTPIDIGMGLFVADMTDEWASALGVRKEGVLVFNVTTDSTAHKLGLRPRFIILEVNTQPVGNAEQLRQMLSSIKSGQDVIFFCRTVLGATVSEHHVGGVMP